MPWVWRPLLWILGRTLSSCLRRAGSRKPLGWSRKSKIVSESEYIGSWSSNEGLVWMAYWILVFCGHGRTGGAGWTCTWGLKNIFVGIMGSIALAFYIRLTLKERRHPKKGLHDYKMWSSIGTKWLVVVGIVIIFTVHHSVTRYCEFYQSRSSKDKPI